jgi:tRNA (guanine-N7-)-methyltransferase
MMELRIPFTWAERRPIQLDRFLYLPPCAEQLHDPTLFVVRQPMVIEYCSGNGEWIAEAARRAPECFWIAVEKKFERARLIWRRMMRMALENLWVVCGDARIFSRFYMPSASAEKVFINFPDPWPKRKHAKHRVIQSCFVQDLERILKPGGSATLVTDDLATSERILLEFARWYSFFPQGFVTEWPNFGTSFFHDLWTRKGCTIRYHRFIYG